MTPLPRNPRHLRSSSATDIVQGHGQTRRLSGPVATDAQTDHFNGPSPHDNMDVPELNTVGPAVCNSMGNLADELAHAFSDSGEEEQDQCEEEEYSHKSTASTDAANTEETKPPFGESNDTESLVLYPSTGRYDSRQDVSGRSSMLTTGIRKAAVDYEGSEYGSGSDLECAGMPVTLISKIERIESLCWRGTNDYGDPDDAIFDRVAGCLRDLGSQSTVEGNASRLITAHTALTTHLAHQTRQLYGLTFPLLSPLAPSLDRKFVEDVVPLLAALSDEMPKPSTLAFNSLTALRSLTSDVVQTLSYLSDSLQMSRQTTVTATRRLKSAKELVSEIRHDEELREEGERWLSRGNWSQRLASRECAVVCGEVIGGFEDVCNGWRQRLLAQAELKI